MGLVPTTRPQTFYGIQPNVYVRANLEYTHTV